MWEVDLIAFVVLGSCWLGYLNAPNKNKGMLRIHYFAISPSDSRRHDAKNDACCHFFSLTRRVIEHNRNNEHRFHLESVSFEGKKNHHQVGDGCKEVWGEERIWDRSFFKARSLRVRKAN